MRFGFDAPTRLSRVRRMSAGGILMLLALNSHAEATIGQPDEAGQYAFEASVDVRLHHSLESDSLSTFLALDRAVEIRWVARERPWLREYRLTTTIEGGALSGTVARWRIESGTGQALDGGRLRAYRLRLPLSIERGLRLRTALEAIRSDGSRLALVERDTTPAPGSSRERFGLPSDRRLTTGQPGDTLGGMGSDRGLLPTTVWTWLAGTSGLGPACRTPGPGQGRQSTRDRGPPRQAAQRA